MQANDWRFVASSIATLRLVVRGSFVLLLPLPLLVGSVATTWFWLGPCAKPDTARKIRSGIAVVKTPWNPSNSLDVVAPYPNHRQSDRDEVIQEHRAMPGVEKLTEEKARGLTSDTDDIFLRLLA